MIQFAETFGGVNFDVCIEDKVNLFSGLSGEGKTFLFKILKVYLKINGVSCICFNNTATDFSESTIKKICTGKKVIIFDNADLYLTQELLDYAIEIADTVIVSMKLYCRLRFDLYNFYAINYSGNSLVVRRENDL